MTANLSDDDYVSTVFSDNCGPIHMMQNANGTYLKLGDTVLTEDMLKELLQVKEFLDSLPPTDTELGRLWVAYKARKRITD